MLFSRTGERQPLLVSNWESFEASESPAGSGDTGSPSLEGTTMVPSSVGNTVGFSLMDSSVQDLFLMTSESVVIDFQPQLAVWPISGKSLQVKTFPAQLGISSWLPGESSLKRLMIPTSKNGWASALQGVQIPFLDL